ncbi:MAG: preprotein translocase subunit SecA [Planctomycetaceae bacterium]|nr:preprotein translocase subunit SecA [Planctomycetaceae bacterium]
MRRQSNAVQLVVRDESTSPRFELLGLSKLFSPLLRNAFAGVATRAALRKWSPLVARIKRTQAKFTNLSDLDLRRESLSLRYRALSGEASSRLLPEAFALMREATDRTLDMQHFDVQLLGGIALHHGAIAEMQTGEGKTLTATLPLYLAALEDKGAHLATANDYLAARDAELMLPAYELLGMSVGIVQSGTSRPKRKQAYACDITYAASREFGFDFLRDRLLVGRNGDRPRDSLSGMLGQSTSKTTPEAVQRELNFVLVDEADSILIDEARTPLIVSSLPGNSPDATAALYVWAATMTDNFEEAVDYEYNHKDRHVTLLAAGRRKVRELDKPELLATIAMFDMYEHVERAIKVAREFFLDRHYVVRDGEIVIVDENTGRLAEGRKWRDGIHQAVEAKEDVEVSVKTGEAARVTVQDFYLRYSRLCGMTGTASTSKPELKRIYTTPVHVIPTNRLNCRQRWPDRVFGNADAKWQAVVAEIEELHRQGRPVLIGTRSIDKSVELSGLLEAAGISHDVLNANRHAEEAEIVAQAGQPGKVTVATNMAGRGTDIKLGEGVHELGGLHVICTELHESARIDRQLIGRCARQGDAGSFRQFMSLDDDVLEAGLGPGAARRYEALGTGKSGSFDRCASVLRAAQAKVERQHYRRRRLLLYQEQERRRMQLEMGQDPYLDATM